MCASDGIVTYIRPADEFRYERFCCLLEVIEDECEGRGVITLIQNFVYEKDVVRAALGKIGRAPCQADGC